MLSLTRKVDYALVALVFLGYRWQQGQGAASAREVARTFGLPHPVLMNTLKALARRGLVRSQRGIGGGYELALNPAGVSLLAVVHAVEGEPEGDEPGHDAAEPAFAHAATGAAVVHRLQQRLHAFLEGLTIADLLEEPTAQGEDHSLVHLQTTERSILS